MDRSDNSLAAHIVSTAEGPVELARIGQGPPVLVLHGTPGGFDGALAMGRFLADAGFEVLAPSRPGYLGTELGARRSIDAQADLLGALLDSLGLKRAGVFSWSGGGPAGYRLAARHPDRVVALAMFAAVSGRYEPPHEGLEYRLVMETRPGNWMLRFLAAHAPAQTISATLAAEGDLTRDEIDRRTQDVLDDPKKRDLVLAIARIVGDRAPRRQGIDNDLARFAEIASLELDRIVAPTLLIHGTVDRDVPPDHSEHAAAVIADAALVRMERGTHLCLFTHPDSSEVQARVAAHLTP